MGKSWGIFQCHFLTEKNPRTIQVLLAGHVALHSRGKKVTLDLAEAQREARPASRSLGRRSSTGVGNGAGLADVATSQLVMVAMAKVVKVDLMMTENANGEIIRG